MKLLTLLIIFCFGLPVSLHAKPEPVKARLVLDRAQVVQDKAFHVGVFFEIEPGWHIYWKDPGVAGLATEIKLTSSPEAAFTEIYWPEFKTFIQPGEIEGRGYEGEVLLYRGARLLKPSENLSIKADVSWLACNEVCVLGKTRLVESVAVGSEEKLANTEVYNQYKGKL